MGQRAVVGRILNGQDVIAEIDIVQRRGSTGGGDVAVVRNDIDRRSGRGTVADRAIYRGNLAGIGIQPQIDAIVADQTNSNAAIGLERFRIEVESKCLIANQALRARHRAGGVESGANGARNA